MALAADRRLAKRPMSHMRRATGLLLVVLLVGCGSAGPLVSTPTPPPAGTGATPGATATPASATTTPAMATSTPSGAWIALSPASGPPGTTVDIIGYLPGGRPAAVATSASGPSATPVRVTGTPPAGGSAGAAPVDHGPICWTNCATGLVDYNAPFTWSSAQPGRFQTRLTVPAVPWLAWDGVHPLAPGDYAIGLPCLTQPQLNTTGTGAVPCTQQPAQLTATFHLTGPTTERCRIGTCAFLQLDPAEGPPGTLVHLHGWAPLSTFVIDAQPTEYDLAIQPDVTAAHSFLGTVQQAPNGDLSGTFQIPLTVNGLGRLDPGSYTLALQTGPLGKAAGIGTLPGGVTVNPLIGTNGVSYGDRLTLAPATLTITAVSTWAALGSITPSNAQWSAARYTATTVVADPIPSQRLAYCDSGGIHVSSDAGVNWTTIPTNGVVQAVVATPFQIFNNNPSPPACLDLVLDPAHPRTYYATFFVVPTAQPSSRSQGRIGVLTTDAGQTWRAVPAPSGYDLAQFGGFQVAGQAVVALFGGDSTSARPLTVEMTSDGGQTWQPGQLPCPVQGPCVRWGPVSTAIDGKDVGYLQYIERSGDGGRTWTTLAWPAPVDLDQGQGQLVALSSSEIALVDGTGPYPLMVSHDGGQTWQVIVLPTLNPAGGPPLLYDGLQLLPTGALLSQQYQGWMLLPPGAPAWCQIPGLTLPNGIVTPQAVGDRLWWLTPPTNSGGAMVPRSVPLSALRCGE